MIRTQDIDTLARTLYGEARGEGYAGMLLVGYVIMNRLRTRYRGNASLVTVCRDPWQFSCWNRNDPNRVRLETVDLTDKDFRTCYRAALEVIDGVNPFSPQVRHYYAKSMPKPPFWAEGKFPVKEHGRHLFYEGIA